MHSSVLVRPGYETRQFSSDVTSSASCQTSSKSPCSEFSLTEGELLILFTLERQKEHGKGAISTGDSCLQCLCSLWDLLPCLKGQQLVLLLLSVPTDPSKAAENPRRESLKGMEAAFGGTILLWFPPGNAQLR